MEFAREYEGVDVSRVFIGNLNAFHLQRYAMSLEKFQNTQLAGDKKQEETGDVGCDVHYNAVMKELLDGFHTLQRIGRA